MALSKRRSSAALAACIAAYLILGAPRRQPEIPRDLRDAPNSHAALEQLGGTGQLQDAREFLVPDPEPAAGRDQQLTAVDFPGNASPEAKLFLKAGADAAAGRTRTDKPCQQKEFLIIGHAGSPLKEMENTVKSFQTALDEGANAIETDVCLTADGVLALWHDWDPNSTVANLRQMGLAWGKVLDAELAPG